MNKYKSALSDIMCCIPYGELKEQEEMIRDLVDKAIPKKVKEVNHIFLCGEYDSTSAICPTCESSVSFDGLDGNYYCHVCGQALDWSEDDE